MTHSKVSFAYLLPSVSACIVMVFETYLTYRTFCSKPQTFMASVCFFSSEENMVSYWLAAQGKGRVNANNIL